MYMYYATSILTPVSLEGPVIVQLQSLCGRYVSLLSGVYVSLVGRSYSVVRVPSVLHPGQRRNIYTTFDIDRVKQK